MTNENKKIREEKLDEANSLLVEIASKLTKYDKIYHSLTKQEKAAVGGVVFHLVSIWGDISAIGAIADRPIGSQLINSLVAFFNSPQSRTPEPPSMIESANGEGDKNTLLN